MIADAAEFHLESSTEEACNVGQYDPAGELWGRPVAVGLV